MVLFLFFLALGFTISPGWENKMMTKINCISFVLTWCSWKEKGTDKVSEKAQQSRSIKYLNVPNQFGWQLPEHRALTFPLNTLFSICQPLTYVQVLWGTSDSDFHPKSYSMIPSPLFAFMLYIQFAKRQQTSHWKLISPQWNLENDWEHIQPNLKDSHV